MVEKERPDIVISCGDHCRDCDELAERYPGPDYYCVPGNCDFFTHGRKEELLIYLEKVPVLITHGHKYQVKRTYNYLREKAESLGVKVVLCGHTHRKYTEKGDNMTIFNPGAAHEGDYGIMEVEGNTVSFAHKTLSAENTEDA